MAITKYKDTNGNWVEAYEASTLAVLKVNNKTPNATGVVNITGEDIPKSSTDNTNLSDSIDAITSAILNQVYPIGRGFIDFTNTDYSNYLGFTWERELLGVTPIGYSPDDTDFNSIGKTGGAKTHSTTYTPDGKNTGTAVTAHTYTPAGKNTGTAVTMNAIELTHSGGAVQSHTLTVNEMPSHTHQAWYFQCNPVLQPNNAGGGLALDPQNRWATADPRIIATGGGQGHTHSFTQPSKHSFTPTTKSITQPTFTGTQATLSHTVTQPTFTGTKATISLNTQDPYQVVAYWKRVA